MSQNNQKQLQLALAFLGASASLYVAYKYLTIKKNLQKNALANTNDKTIQSHNKITFLTQQQAEFRSRIINSPVTYELIYSLQKGEQFSAIVIIQFQLKSVQEGIFLDFHQGQISKLQINKQSVSSLNLYDGTKINLPPQQLVIGQNEVIIEFTRKYSNDGHGLHSFIDTDSKQYVYSHCEPWHANKIYPCFDQPDLRGIFKLLVLAPSDWIVISNEKLQVKETISNFLQKEPVNQINYINIVQNLKVNFSDNDNVWMFKETPQTPAYIFFIGAGPYREIICPQQNLHNEITMSLYCRESLYEYLLKDAQEIFQTVTQCMEFYERFFGHKFQYSKYDHIFCPEYNIGAMENPGAVTVNDQFIYKEAVIPDRKLRRANIIAHELCHMWFGDFVAIQWWNDTWLKESFADFLSYLALSKVKIDGIQTRNAWMAFFQRKGWGYTTDQKKTTHPISTPVEDTEKAEIIFDGITYSKGAATLKQLYHLVGEDNFSEALKSYFDSYGWQNATLQNFLDSIQRVLINKFDIQKHPYLNLDFWSREWLQKAGLNEILVEWNPSNTSPQSKLLLVQTPYLPEHPTLRYHKMKVAFVDIGGNLYHIEDIVIQNTKFTEVQYDGSQQPVAIIPNFNDEAYIKIQFDNHSVEFLKSNLNKIQDNLTRFMIWRSLWEQARDARMSPLEFIKTILLNIEFEENLTILESVLLYAEGIFEFIPHNVVDKLDLKGKIFEKIKNMLIITVKQSNSDKNKLILLIEKLFCFSANQNDSQFLFGWLNGQIEDFNNVELSVNNKWKIAKIVARSKLIQNQVKEELVQKILAVDKSDQGLYYAKQINTIFASSEQQEQIWESFFDKNTTESVRTFEYIMEGFNDSSKIQENKKYFKEFFKNVPIIFEERSREYAKAFLTKLFPSCDDLEWLLREVQQLMKTCKQDQQWLIRLLSEKEDIMLKKIQCYEIVRKNPNL